MFKMATLYSDGQVINESVRLLIGREKVPSIIFAVAHGQLGRVNEELCHFVFRRVGLQRLLMSFITSPLKKRQVNRDVMSGYRVCSIITSNVMSRDVNAKIVTRLLLCWQLIN